MSVLNLSPDLNKVQDYFTPLNTVMESDADADFGSGGPLLLPDIKEVRLASENYHYWSDVPSLAVSTDDK